MKTLIYTAISILHFIPVGAWSAEISLINPDDNLMGCRINLKGQIAEGDSLALERLTKDWIERDGLDNYNATPTRICLDSPGGSYLEGVRLAATINRLNLSTAVAEHKRCESACALAFMGGSYFYFEGESAVRDRVIHPTAKLGFHAPGLEIPKGQFTEEDLSTAYDIALQAVAELSELRATTNVQFAESLFTRVLRTSPQEMYYIETVGEATRLGIDIEFSEIYSAPLDAIAENLCFAAAGYFDDVEIAERVKYGYIDFNYSDYEIVSRGGFYDEGSVQCTIQRARNFSDAPRGQDFIVSFGNTSDGRNRDTTFHLAASFPTQTIIRNLPFQESIQSSDYNRMLASNAPQYCDLEGTYVDVTNVTEFTNLRAQAGIQFPVILRVPLDENVRQQSPGYYFATQQCLNACDRDYQPAIDQCIDSNEVWIEVEYEGRRGFLSRKYLREVP